MTYEYTDERSERIALEFAQFVLRGMIRSHDHIAFNLGTHRGRSFTISAVDVESVNAILSSGFTYLASALCKLHGTPYFALDVANLGLSSAFARVSLDIPVFKTFSISVLSFALQINISMASYSLGRVQFGEKTVENRKIALQKSTAVARFNDVCAECSYCGVVIYFTAGGSYAIEFLMEHLKAAHGGLSIGVFGEVSAPGVATTHATSGTMDLFSSDEFRRLHHGSFLEGAGRMNALASDLIDFAGKYKDVVFQA
ncbi:uncharacterized protein SCHCODRAFT_02663886 [Schizophyllum commune H4-8]|uniref:Uncharacterized protein n=1 Tax=Schizophyllum commune (strain H4-8 / FGSC 9210) TaxID=578458 RepID=D8PYL6_SCHCM|nr:uncharacterized protein SCHCODRAFT_02663886 [Schizophyllum commune H4-8]KAI5896022.1 hypothetical protein SCHCODRAFT_02663886 [Schizophyllum commune H4-8]